LVANRRISQFCVTFRSPETPGTSEFGCTGRSIADFDMTACQIVVVLDLSPAPNPLDLLDGASGSFSMLRCHVPIESQVATRGHPYRWVIRESVPVRHKASIGGCRPTGSDINCIRRSWSQGAWRDRWSHPGGTVCRSALPTEVGGGMTTLD
jgi:hypothetical protein